MDILRIIQKIWYIYIRDNRRDNAYAVCPYSQKCLLLSFNYGSLKWMTLLNNNQHREREGEGERGIIPFENQLEVVFTETSGLLWRATIGSHETVAMSTFQKAILLLLSLCIPCSHKAVWAHGQHLFFVNIFIYLVSMYCYVSIIPN